LSSKPEQRRLREWGDARSAFAAGLKIPSSAHSLLQGSIKKKMSNILLAFQTGSCMMPTTTHKDTMKTLNDVVKEIVVEQLGVFPEQVTPESNIVNDLGADSLDSVELMMAFESEFNLSIDNDQFDDVKTVGDIVRILKELGVPETF